ncbi:MULTISPECIES: dihydroxyacetone kinase subunit DhaL [Faecalicoccus]|uniref:phosphoenolpyruvate--glycerone phosphotransferase n=1 Tax=Faecalicoccus pleomorphus TaxID=1323 RepID=A0AAW6CSM5_9FIRM|nr:MULTISPECIES: dihydroxyacetone kinase subunit DhaL [Faecalicoccus]MDB7980264.1 dihydroxyacetone kinase subunit DhaL [Faecalicoccus pleomorphus]MDB7982598.1 dihydroxyacetone kinase subunit DhaL [Faecalicoccus pleomorphus]MDY5233382.1 dihydroxyacetone kinase subunit DhaL [Faecalicoccus sp.]
MEHVLNEDNACIVKEIIQAIHNNSVYLSEIDGETGDGDHGVNMNKGFLMADVRIKEDDSFSEALKKLGKTLVMDIGGSMGPIYGTFFSKLSRTLKTEEKIDAKLFEEALKNAEEGLMNLAGAKPGDKTLVDTIVPAYESFKEAQEAGKGFKECLEALKIGAEQGKESTRDMVAKLGRASRLGERSKGHLDAGATSCCIILQIMADGMIKRMVE